MAHFTNTTTRDLVTEWPYWFQTIPSDSDFYEYLGVYANELSRVDAFIDTLYEQRFIENATGKELEKLGAGLGVTRRANETDDSFRYRIQLRYAQAVSNGTAEDMAYVFETAFGEDADRVSVSPSPNQPVLICVAPEDALSSIPLTTSELEDELADAMPCGTDITLSSNTTFTFSTDDTSAPAYAGGFGEGEWAGRNE